MIRRINLFWILLLCRIIYFLIIIVDNFCHNGELSEERRLNSVDKGGATQILPVPLSLSRYIKCHTWKKDYQGLFDYESKEIEKEDLKVNQSGVLVKEKKSTFGFIPCDELSVEVVN